MSISNPSNHWKTSKKSFSFYDGDKAGSEGIKKNAEIIRKLKPGIKISHVDTPEGEDINSLSQSHEPEIFAHLLESRKEIEAFYFHQRVQLKSLMKRKKARVNQ
jgi:DNA primase